MPQENNTTASHLFKFTAEDFVRLIKGEFEGIAKHDRYYHNGTVIVNNIEVKEKILIQQDDIFKKPVIINNSAFESLEIRGGTFGLMKTGEAGLTINSALFKGNITISGAEFNAPFFINGGNFQHITIWNGNIGNFSISGGVFKQKIFIQGGMYERFVITGGEFFDGFSFRGGSINMGLWIEKGLFHKPFTIAGGTINRVIQINGGEFNEGFIVENGQLKVPFYIGGGNFKKHYDNNGKIDGGFQINGGEMGNIVFDKFPKNPSLSVSQVKISGGTIENADFNDIETDAISVAGSTVNIKQLGFNNTYTIDQIEFSGARVNTVIIKNQATRQLIINENTNIVKLFLNTSRSIEAIDFKGGTIEEISFDDEAAKSVIFSGSTLHIGSLIFNNTTTIDKALFTEGVVKSLLIKNGPIKSIVFDGGNLNINTISFVNSSQVTANLLNLKLNNLFFDKAISHKDSIIHINNVHILEIKFDTYYNFGYISFNNVRAKANTIDTLKTGTTESKHASRFTLINSSLGKTEFINCDLSSFDNFIYESSKITDVFTIGTTMPNVVKSHSLEGENHDQTKLAYSQLKKIHENRGDFVKGNFFYSLEMDSHYKSISWIEQPFEKFNLWLNSFSSDFGANWQKALFITLLFTSSMYVLYCYSIGFRIAYPYTPQEYKLFIELASFYITDFINPLHKTDFLSSIDIKNNSMSRSIDGISRIFTAYLIYQFVQAFRKYGKR